ncbi:MAG TPA: hypothetical protein VF941_00410 [Clostridia bacterium]
MNELLEEYRKEFLIKHLYEYEDLTGEEYNALDPKEREGFTFDSENFVYRKNVPANVTQSEINECILLKTLECMERMDQKMTTIKNIVVFWFALTILSIIGYIFLATAR